MPVTLRDYWVETITRKEALRRLATRDIDDERRIKIERSIPPQTEHYLTFDKNVFREYAYSGSGTAALLLQLPGYRARNLFVVIVPLLRSMDGKRAMYGYDFHSYGGKNGKLLENDVHRPTFRHSREPVILPLNVSFVQPSPRPPSLSFACCEACEWVHSALDIHCADWICCLFQCFDNLVLP